MNMLLRKIAAKMGGMLINASWLQRKRPLREKRLESPDGQRALLQPTSCLATTHMLPPNTETWKMTSAQPNLPAPQTALAVAAIWKVGPQMPCWFLAGPKKAWCSFHQQAKSQLCSSRQSKLSIKLLTHSPHMPRKVLIFSFLTRRQIATPNWTAVWLWFRKESNSHLYTVNAHLFKWFQNQTLL